MIGERYVPRRHARLFAPACVFLSASAMRADRRRESDSPPAADEVLLAAVLEVVEQTLARGWNLVFGGHPAISPMVLSVVQRLGNRGKRVICFQSEFFADQVPTATADLWEFGSLLWTPAVPAATPDREESLRVMRTAMIGVPKLLCGVFLGGMMGVRKEAQLFAELQPNLPRYAFPATGSVARDLFEEQPSSYAGGDRKMEKALRDELPSSVLARRILAHAASRLP